MISTYFQHNLNIILIYFQHVFSFQHVFVLNIFSTCFYSQLLNMFSTIAIQMYTEILEDIRRCFKIHHYLHLHFHYSLHVFRMLSRYMIAMFMS